MFAALRLIPALILVVFCHLLGIPVGLSGQFALRRAVKVSRIRTARRPGAEAAISLRQVRAWYDVSTVASMAGLFNQIYEDTLFVARDTTVMALLVTPYGAQGYATRTIPIYPQLVAQEVNEAQDYNNPTEWTKESEAVFTPKEVITQVIYTDRRQQTDPENARRDAAVEMGGAISTKIDSDLVDLFTSFTTGKGSANSALTITHCAAALAKLRNNKVRGPFSYVLHPYHWHDIWVQLGQPSANQALLGEIANQALRDYFAGRFLMADWFTSANIDVDGSDDAISGVFNREALALDTREAPTLEPERDASLRAWELNLHAGYAVGVRRADYGIKLTADATEPT
jgi:hypothetical protein